MSSPDDSNPPIADPNPPTAAGYELVGEIAQSGLGAVYRARNTQLGLEVALKVLPLGADPRRLFDEGRITGQLQHPGIPPVYEIGVLPDGRSFMAMKLVKGCTLDELLQERGSRTPDNPRFLAVFEQVCQTIAYAHYRGVIHRDLKPANVMIGAFGEVLVMGWGLARVMAPNEPPVPAGPQNILGTPAYMPPEQARGEYVGTRSDVFGLGGLLCAILTGEPVFQGEHPMALIRRSAAGEVTEAFARLDTCGAEPELIALAKRCLAPNPADRPADAGEVANAVATYRRSAERRHETAPEPPRLVERPPRHRRQVLILVFLIALVVLLLVNAILLWPRV